METSPPLTGTLWEGAESVFGVPAEASTLVHLGNMSKKKGATYFPIFKYLGFLLF